MTMATLPHPPSPLAAPRSRAFTRRLTSRGKGGANRSSRPPACTLPRSADLAGRSVALSADVPAEFDAPLASHHRQLGQWVARQEQAAGFFTRSEARALVERVFNAAVLDILNLVAIANLRVAVLQGDNRLPPALALICDDIGQLDLGWIEKSNVLRDALQGPVAPLGWRAAAYKALAETLNRALPVFGFEDMMEELSAYHWDGEMSDEAVLHVLTEFHGLHPDDIEPDTLPSAVMARRPDWMTAAAAPMKRMPKGLRERLRCLRDTHKALGDLRSEGHAWRLGTDDFHEYLPEYCDRSTMPPLTIVPFDDFQREIDTVGQSGMEYGFHDIIGLCPISDPATIDGWFKSLRVGAQYLLAAQNLIGTNPSEM